MRVTQNSNFDTINRTINQAKSRMENYQHQASTMKKLNEPSDDPVAAAKVLEVRTEKVNNEQFIQNAKMAETFLNNTDHVLEELGDVVVRAKEIALGQSSGASSTDDTRVAVAEEITQLYKHALASANRRVGDRYLLGGYRTDQPPVDNEGRYLGDDGQMMIEVARDVYIPMNLPGISVFNTKPNYSSDARELAGASASGEDEPQLEGNPEYSLEPAAAPENVNIFNELQTLRISLLTGNLEGIRSTLERFDDMHSQIISARSKIGARIQGLRSTANSLERHDITNAELTSHLEDADMNHVMSELAKEETIYRTALASSKRLVQPTLMDFLS